MSSPCRPNDLHEEGIQPQRTQRSQREGREHPVFAISVLFAVKFRFAHGVWPAPLNPHPGFESHGRFPVVFAAARLDHRLLVGIPPGLGDVRCIDRWVLQAKGSECFCRRAWRRCRMTTAVAQTAAYPAISSQ